MKLPNIFINIEFVIEKSYLTIEFIKPAYVTLFLSCTFRSNSPSCLEKSQKYAEVFLKYSVDSFKKGRSEDLEHRELSDKDKEEIFELTTLKNIGNPDATLIIVRGKCLLIKCEFYNCLGTAVLCAFDDTPDENTTLPFAYLKDCIIAYCGGDQFAGVEVRLYGSLLLDNCSIHDNGEGVSAWRFPKKVIIRNCKVFSNKKEGIGTEEKEIYDNDSQIVIDNCQIHHNQIGLSLQYSREISVTNSVIHSNRSWGIYLRNATIAYFGNNDLFRNHCGGVKVAFNRFNQTLFSNNRIHEHTGPDFVQTRYVSESEELCNRRRGFQEYTDKKNRVPILLLNNLCYNNELQYASFEDTRIFASDRCHFPKCNKPNAKLLCKYCRYTKYCNLNCLKQHEQAHTSFCKYFTKNKILKIILDRKWIIGKPANETIKDFTEELPLTHAFYKREFLIKANSGYNHFGLNPNVQLNDLLSFWQRKCFSFSFCGKL